MLLIKGENMIKTCPVCKIDFESNTCATYCGPKCGRKARVAREKIQYENFRRKISHNKTTLCTCPTCREQHTKNGHYNSKWVYCDSCDNRREVVMSGFMGAHIYC